MATAVKASPRGAATGGDQTLPADVFVAFGITGDLAKVMTFMSLYRLERRGLLDCPIVGVAVDDWTVDELRAHARRCIEDCGEPVDDEVFDRFANRLSYIAATSAIPTPSSAWGRPSRARAVPSSTWRSRRSCSAPW